MGKRVRGNGKMVTETRSSGSFDGVRVSGAIDLFVRTDSVTAVRVDGDENLLKYVEVELDGSMLRIRTRSGINLKPTRSIRVYVSAPEFSRLEASGACDIFTVNKINSTGTLNVDLSGASDAKLEVNAPGVKVEVSGAGSCLLYTSRCV